MSEEESAFAAYKRNGTIAAASKRQKSKLNQSQKGNKKQIQRLKAKQIAKANVSRAKPRAKNSVGAATISSAKSEPTPKAGTSKQTRQRTQPAEAHVEQANIENQPNNNALSDADMSSASSDDMSYEEHVINSAEEQEFNLQAIQTKNAPKTKRGQRQNAVTVKINAVTGRKSKLKSTNNNNNDIANESLNISTKAHTFTAPAIKLEALSDSTTVTKLNSISEGLRAFGWLLAPVSTTEFFAKYWEKHVCLIKRNQPNYYSHLLSFEAIDRMLIKNHIEFTKNIDITSYQNGVRETLNPEGRAMPPVVWEHYGRGCSIRLLNPHTFVQSLYELNAQLQEYFHCLVGANAYLTPPNSQGFAPHYDDIEAFILQLEGRKRWRLYKPRTPSEVLPRCSSENFKQDEVGEPILDVILEPGDLLYFPRGTIHQACTEPGFHSLHITLSVYQKQSYADLFEQMLPTLLKTNIEDSVGLRRGLPLHIWQHAGIANNHLETAERAQLLQNISAKLTKMLNVNSEMLENAFDAAVDQLAKKYQREALPPHVSSFERSLTIFGSKNRVTESGDCECDYELDVRTNVRLLRANILRLVYEEGKIHVYYYVDNSKQYCEYEANFIEINTAEAEAIEVLIKSYPAYVGVAQLPLPEDEQKLELATGLFERGLLMLEKPFN